MHDILDRFHDRMRNIAPSAQLHKSIARKGTLSSNYGFNSFDEQVNIVYALLVYILQKSLKDEECTLKDMAGYLQYINIEFFKKDIAPDVYSSLANCIVNEVILNDGNMTSFNCLDTANNEYKKTYIQLVEHSRSMISNNATYKLTETGYNLVLSTLEMESNMKLQFHEFVFHESLKRKNFDQALIDIKNILALSKKQIQALKEGINRIRENVITFEHGEYERIRSESLDIAENQTSKFKSYEREIEKIEDELKEKEFGFLYTPDQEELDDIKGNLKKLDLIKKEISKIVYEHANMMSMHSDFEDVYTRALDSSIEYFKRDKVNIKEDIGEEVKLDLTKLDFVSYLLLPLYSKKLDKKYDICSVLEAQKSKVVEYTPGTNIEVVIDEEEQRKQKELEKEKNREKIKQYENILAILFNFAVNHERNFTLSSFIEHIKKLKEFKTLTKDMYQLREVLIELLDLRYFNIKELKNEAMMLKAGYDNSGDFQPLKAILATIKNDNTFKCIKSAQLSMVEPGIKVKITMDFMELTVDDLIFNFELDESYDIKEMTQ